MDPISALIGAGGSLIGGLMSSTAASNANATNMMMNTGAWKAQQIQNEAGALGVSPLALLGNMGQNIPMQSVGGSDAAVGASVGQNIGRALSAGRDGDDRLQKLQIEHQQLVNAGLQQDLIARAAKHSLDAVNGASPIPAFSQFYDNRPGGTEGKFWARSRPYAESSFAGDPAQMARGFVASMQDVFNQYKGYFTAPPSFEIRPDIWRQLGLDALGTQGTTN